MKGWLQKELRKLLSQRLWLLQLFPILTAVKNTLVVNHAGVIDLLSSSMGQYKRYGCTRMKVKVVNEVSFFYVILSLVLLLDGKCILSEWRHKKSSAMLDIRRH